MSVASHSPETNNVIPARTLGYDFSELEDRSKYYFKDFTDWLDTNPGIVDEHLALCQNYLEALNYAPIKSPKGRARELEDEALYFSVLNRGTADVNPCREALANFATPGRILRATRFARRTGNGTTGDNEAIIAEFSKYNEFLWLQAQANRLYGVLPDTVIRSGGMGKVARTVLGVLTVAATHPSITSRKDRKAAILSTIPGAYAYAASYPIIDDILQDSQYFPPQKVGRFHETIVSGLSTGKDIDRSSLPDHGLVDELLFCYDLLRKHYPYGENRQLYSAMLSMYIAQHEDASSKSFMHEELFYPHIAMKSGLSRIVAHLLSPREPDPQSMENLLRSLTRNQLLDDFRDQFEDARNGITTPFTMQPAHPSSPNPFYTFFAYNAYIAKVVYGNNPGVEHVLARLGSYEVAKLFLDPQAAALLKTRWGGQPYLDRWMQTASTLPNNTNTASRLNRSEKKILAKITDMTSKRETQDVDPRTFISDARSFVKSLLEYEFLGDNPIHETVRYVLGGDSKYIRSGMALMLADSLKVRPETIAPLLVSIEMSHAASLLFDDLPAQDNAETRRGQPTAHKKFPEYTAQLAGIAMLNRSIGVLTELSTHFNSEKVTKIISYVTDKVGGDLTLGQCKDLANIADDEEDILKMYALKTSSLLEAALIPVMVLAGRSTVEIENLTTFAHHAGIVYQLQDDILDATANSEQLGKKTNKDEGKNNIVRTYGVDEAIRLRDRHFQAALEALSKLPFETTLLSGTVTYFASRTR